MLKSTLNILESLGAAQRRGDTSLGKMEMLQCLWFLPRVSSGKKMIRRSGEFTYTKIILLPAWETTLRR